MRCGRPEFHPLLVERRPSDGCCLARKNASPNELSKSWQISLISPPKCINIKDLEAPLSSDLASLALLLRYSMMAPLINEVFNVNLGPFCIRNFEIKFPLSKEVFQVLTSNKSAAEPNELQRSTLHEKILIERRRNFVRIRMNE